VEELINDVARLMDLLREAIAERGGEAALARIEALREAAIDLRRGALPGGRDAFANMLAALDVEELDATAHAFTQMFHLMNRAEEQHRIRTLRRRDRPGAPPSGSIADACAELKRAGVPADEVRTILGRLFVMPVLTAHPTEARRRTVLDHLSEVSGALDRLDDPRFGERARAHTTASLRESIATLYLTEEARAARPSPLDEVRAGLHVFDPTLFDVTPAIVTELEDALAAHYPGEPFDVKPFLKWGTWIGGDRDGNPNVTADVTRAALERHRTLAIARSLRDVDHLGRALSMSVQKVGSGRLAALEASLADDRARLPDVSARARRSGMDEPVREKLWHMRARLEATLVRGDAGYAQPEAYVDDLRLIARSLNDVGLHQVARGRVRHAELRASAFGFHLATMDLRQHSSIHEAAVAELLARGGVPRYAELPEDQRLTLLGGLLERADIGTSRDRTGLSPATRELLSTLDVIGRARRDQGPEACERYVVSFTNAASDLLEVLFLVRAANLAPDELRPVPLLEQLEDLDRAEAIARQMLALGPVRAALRGELEVMIGYSDSGKQVGYVASAVALRRAQEALATVADEAGITLTVFHGRGGAVGRGGGPANRAIRAQPARALRGRLRVTEQGETIAARYGRPEIARRDREQMVHAVLLGSLIEEGTAKAADEGALDRAAVAARRSYEALIGDRERLARYTVAATPIHEVAALPLASRPAARRPGLSFEELRAIPWVFSWNQSRHGLPGWFGLGSALDAIIAEGGLERAREMYASWPFFHALVDNAQLALARSDIDVASHYARLADAEAPDVFPIIRAEHARTLTHLLAITGASRLLAAWPTIDESVTRRNPYVDVLSHAQIELLRRLRATEDETARARLRKALFVTINGIAAGLMTAG
jgi:phosphoenolpyruvate carboxylase